MSESDDEFAQTDQVMKCNRHNIIKLLQEQIHGLSFYKTDYENMKARLELAENTLVTAEANYKLKIDELNQQIAELENRNQVIIDQTLRFKFQQVSENQAVAKESSKETAKWRKKYEDLLANSDQAKYRQKYKDARDENKALKEQQEALQVQYNEIQKNDSEKDKLIEQLKNDKENLSKNITDMKSEITKLESSNSSLSSDVKTLKKQKQKKTALLVQTRTKQEKEAHQKKLGEKELSSKIEQQRKQLISKDGEIARLNVALENEVRLRKRIERQSEKYKKNATNAVGTLNESIDKLKQENSSLKQDKQQVEENESSLEVEVVFLRNKTQELEEKLRQAGKVHKRNAKLEENNNTLRSTIENLQCSISSIQTDEINREDELRSIISKYVDGITRDTDWVVLTAKADGYMGRTKGIEHENERLKAKLQRSKEKKHQLKEDLENMTITANETQKELEEVNAINTVRFATSSLRKQSTAQISRRPSFADNASVRSRATINGSTPMFAADIAIAASDLDDLNHFKNIVLRKIDVSNYQARKTMAIAFAKLSNEEVPELSMRTIALVSVFAIRFKRFHRSDPYDPTTILSFATPVGRKELSTEEKLISQVDAMIEENNNLLQRSEESSAIDSSNKEEIQKLNRSIEDASVKTEQYKKEIENLQKQLQEAKSATDDKPNNGQIEHLQNEIVKVRKSEQNARNELESVKSELQNLIEAVNERTSDAQITNHELIQIKAENEELHQQLHDLQVELDRAQAQLKEKTRDILSLERKNNKRVADANKVAYDVQSQTKRPNTVKFQTQEQRAFVLNQSVREGLTAMQNSIISPSKYSNKL